MTPKEIPLVSQVFESGADDRVLDGLLLAGPFVVGTVVVLGRRLMTQAIVVAYLGLFVVYVLFRGFQSTVLD